MKILILTPDTDIDRRIILQAHSLIKKGFEITIIGVPHSGGNFLSGDIDPNITIKRIDLQHIKYHSRIVRFYKNAHRKIMGFAHKRNDFLNEYANKNLIYVDGKSKFRILKKIKNKLVSLNTKLINGASTLLIRLFQRMVNLFYSGVLKIFRTFNINFFPIFDHAFYSAGIIEENVDLVVANDLPSLQAGYLIAKEKNIPLVYDAHENYTEQITLPKRYAKLLEQVEVEVLPKVDFWIVPNDLLGKSMIDKYQEKYNLTIKEPLVIQNAVNRWDEYSNVVEENILKRKLNLAEDTKILLFQGGFLANRNLENLVRSMRYVKNSKVVLVMLGFGNFVEVLKRLAKRNKVEDKVFFMDAVPQSELLRYTTAADVGIIPYPAIDNNTYYCSPNKLYEFIQARLPILANDLPFLKKMIEGEGIGRVQNFSKPQLIAAAIDGIFDSEEELLRYKVNINNASDIHCWEVEEEKLLSQYGNLIKEVVHMS